MRTDRGRPAVAVVSGTVVQTIGRLGGNQVKLFGDDGVAYYYTHLDAFGAKGKVGAGSVIGYVGSTGNASPDAPHLHFAIFRLGPERQWWKGEPINPFLVLSEQ